MLLTLAGKLGWRYLAAILVALAALVAHAWYYFPFFADDALISLQYARRLLEGHGLTWTDGPPVEGYSNLLFVLLVAGLGSLGLDLIFAARLLGLLGMGAAALALIYAYGPKQPAPASAAVSSDSSGDLGRELAPGSIAAAIAGALALVLSGPIAIWAIGGLEQSLLAALLAWTFALLFRQLPAAALSPRVLVLPGLLMGLVSINRPDGLLLAGALFLGLVVTKGLRRQNLLGLFVFGVIPCLFYLGQLAFRLLYYGDWVPNTARVKIAFTEHYVDLGLLYLKRGSSAFIALLIAGAFVLVLAALRQVGWRRLVLLFFPFALWSGYLVVVGGDIFPGHRHLVVQVLVLSFLIAEAASWLLKQRPLWIRAAGMIALAGLLGWHGQRQLHDPRNKIAQTERWEWDGQVIGLLLKEAFGQEQPLLAVTASGCLPYWSELPALDMYGLNDPYLPRHKPKSFGSGFPGHELGDGRYLLSREPDLILYHIWGFERPGCINGRQMLASPEFPKNYTLTTFEGREPRTVRSRIFVRFTSPKIGIARDAGRITIPGYLVNGNRRSVAHLDEQGRIGMGIDRRSPAQLPRLELPAGSWQLQAAASGAPLTLEVRSLATRQLLGQGAKQLRFTLAQPATISVQARLTGAAEQAHLRQLIFEGQTSSAPTP